MDVTRRFSDRVDDYDRYRPRYPAALATWLEARGMGAGSPVADVGAGTGILANLLLAMGCRVRLIDPNLPMLARGRQRLHGEESASFVCARAEATALASRSVDWITAGQAFHWFDQAPARREFARILRPGGRVLLVWNDHRLEPGFMTDYVGLMTTWGHDYHRTSFRTRPLDQEVTAFFGGDLERAVFHNTQELDRDGLVGRYFSSSYMPARGAPDHDAAHSAALDLFARHENEGRVTMIYDTRAFLGRLPPDGG